MKDCVHYNLLNAIRDRVPSNTNVANLLTEILCIGKEAAYRRLRGEVAFTLGDVAAISRALDISIDNVIGRDSEEKSKPFKLQLTRHVNPGIYDYNQLEEFLSILYSGRKNQYREVGSSANVFPQTIFFRFPYITKFYLLRWLYQWDGLNNVKSLADIIIEPKLADIYKRYLEESMLVTKTYYIWDTQVFHYLINDIKCFADINFISQEDVLALKEDILDLIDYMESLATKGSFETGMKIQFYLSSVNFETTYSYLQMDNFYLSHIKAFTLNAAVSLDKCVFDRLKNWIESLKRLSVLISESGEIQRVQFFKDQRELVKNAL